MTVSGLTVIDSRANLSLNDASLRVPGANGLTATVSKVGAYGQSVVTLSNGLVEFDFLPGRGLSVWRGRAGEVPIGWDSPVKDFPQSHQVNLTERGGLGWLHGFNELVCRCGLASNGPPGNDVGDELTLHGRVANLPAHFVRFEADSSGSGSIRLIGKVLETSMFGRQYLLETECELAAGRRELVIRDHVTNASAQTTDFSLLYHVNVGRPFLEAGSTVHVAAKKVVPRDARAAEGIGTWAVYEGPRTSYTEQAYFFEPSPDAAGNGRVVLVNSHCDMALGLTFPVTSLPHFTLWKCTGADQNGYVTGLEPGVNLPNFRAFEREQGRLPSLMPGGKFSTELRLQIAETAVEVAGLLAGIPKSDAFVSDCPQPGWSPAGVK